MTDKPEYLSATTQDMGPLGKDLPSDDDHSWGLGLHGEQRWQQEKAAGLLQSFLSDESFINPARGELPPAVAQKRSSAFDDGHGALLTSEGRCETEKELRQGGCVWCRMPNGLG
jgi:hypothetical protein